MKEYLAEIKKENIPEIFRGVCEQEYLRIYNAFADESEGFYKKRNDEYDKLFGKQLNYDTDHYNSWMAEKIEQRLSELNNSRFLDFTVGRIDCDIVGHLKGVPESRVWLRIFEA